MSNPASVNGATMSALCSTRGAAVATAATVLVSYIGEPLRVWGWGNNVYGQAGTGSAVERLASGIVAGLTGVVGRFACRVAASSSTG